MIINGVVVNNAAIIIANCGVVFDINGPQNGDENTKPIPQQVITTPAIVSPLFGYVLTAYNGISNINAEFTMLNINFIKANGVT